MRRRVGLQAWPLLRRGEAELAAQVGRALGARRFNQAFSAGTKLNQREAIAVLKEPPGISAQAS